MAGQTLTEDAEAKEALTNFVMDCDDLVELERRLSRFNIFRVLRAARNEIRHSNMLGWLLDPEESHGLGDRFLRRWLMNVVHDAPPNKFNNVPSPIEIDVLDADYVEVVRERAGIDVLVIIETGNERTWIVCIENKVDAVQQEDQLLRYRKYVKAKHPDAERTLFIFLTKNSEMPNDPEWLVTTYNEVESVLRACVKERGKAVGREPRLLIKQYLDLLAEDFVDQSDSAALARKIYRQHKKAIDFILANRDDPVLDGSSALEPLVASNALALGIVMVPLSKGVVRFVPKDWDVPQNGGGTHWGPNSRYVACELNFWPKTVELQITIAKGPDDWVDRVWERAASLPFNKEGKQRARTLVKPYKARSEFRTEDLAGIEANVASAIFDWMRGELQKPQFKEAVEIIRGFLLELKVPQV